MSPSSPLLVLHPGISVCLMLRQQRDTKHAEFVHAEISSKTNEGACENRWERFLTTLEKLVVESEKTAMTYPYGWVW